MTKKDAADPAEIIEEADRRREESTAHAEQTLTYFIEEVDGLLPRQTVIDRLQGYLDVDEVGARNALAQVVGDVVDPVQQVPTGDERYVGIIDLHEYEDEGAYGYVHYSDRFGRRNRVVCAQCVQEKELDENVAHATQGEGTSPENADWQDLLDTVTGHYADAHDTAPDSVEIGASLVSSTTMGGNTAWHDGNVSGGSNITISSQSVSVDQGAGSGLNADQVDGDDAADIGGGPVPIYGDGSDGAISRSSNVNENGAINADGYTVEGGVTCTVSNGILIIHSKNDVTINGTIDANTTGGPSGNANTGSSTAGDDGGAGTDAYVTEGFGSGGSGGSTTHMGDHGSGGGGGGGGGSDDASGGDGGDPGSLTDTTYDRDALRMILSPVQKPIYDLSAYAGAGGGGGGQGGGDHDRDGPSGGDGGNGGGIVVILCDGTISGSGTITANGGDGTDGDSASSYLNGGGGGGGGGMGGLIILAGGAVDTSNMTLSVSGGSGGTGGGGHDEGGDGGDGGNGDDGEIIEVIP